PPALWHCAITCAEASSLVAPLALKPTRPSTNTPVPTATEMSFVSSIAPPGPPAQAVFVEIATAITPAATSGATKRVPRMPPLLDVVLNRYTSAHGPELSNGQSRRSGRVLLMKSRGPVATRRPPSCASASRSPWCPDHQRRATGPGGPRRPGHALHIVSPLRRRQPRLRAVRQLLRHSPRRRAHL